MKHRQETQAYSTKLSIPILSYLSDYDQLVFNQRMTRSSMLMSYGFQSRKEMKAFEIIFNIINIINNIILAVEDLIFVVSCLYHIC